MAADMTAVALMGLPTAMAIAVRTSDRTAVLAEMAEAVGIETSHFANADSCQR